LSPCAVPTGALGSIRACALIVLTSCAIAPAPGRAQSALYGNEVVRLELGGGWFVPLEETNRSSYGGGGSADLAIVAPVTRNLAVVVESGYSTSAGDEIQLDPTFDAPDSRYWMVPIAFGIRGRPGDETGRRASVDLGIAATTVLTWWRGPVGPRKFEPALGVQFEMQTEVNWSAGWGTWFRGRLPIVSATDYHESIDLINLSALHLEMGISWRLGSLTPRSEEKP